MTATHAGYGHNGATRRRARVESAVDPLQDTMQNIDNPPVTSAVENSAPERPLLAPVLPIAHKSLVAAAAAAAAAAVGSCAPASADCQAEQLSLCRQVHLVAGGACRKLLRARPGGIVRHNSSSRCRTRVTRFLAGSCPVPCLHDLQLEYKMNNVRKRSSAAAAAAAANGLLGTPLSIHSSHGTSCAEMPQTN
jgi:hypothetical protein